MSEGPHPPPSSSGPTSGGERRPQPRTRAPGAYLNLPLWQRFVISLIVAAALLTAMVVWVSGHNTDTPPASQQSVSPQANREAETLIRQDQAPHSGRLARGLSPAAGLTRVIHTRLAAQVRSGALSGPLEPGHCRPAGARAGARRGFSCSFESGSVTYPFLGAVDTATRRITYCKHDPPPIPSENSIPVSPRCRA